MLLAYLNFSEDELTQQRNMEDQQNKNVNVNLEMAQLSLVGKCDQMCLQLNCQSSIQVARQHTAPECFTYSNWHATVLPCLQVVLWRIIS